MLSLVRYISKYKWLLISSFILSACASAQTVVDSTQSADAPGEQGEEVTRTSPGTSVLQPNALPAPTRTPEGEDPGVDVSPATPPFLPEEKPPSGATSQFSTDFSIHSVPYSEILSGGPPKDGIPAIDNPQFININQSGEWLAPAEPVILFRIGDDARAYPLQILTWHEIVNDTVGDVPVVVTFCPLCNTAIAFERMVEGEVFDFGTTGRLRFSNLIMYDRQTETWWQQATGEAIAGKLTGTQLQFLPAAIIAWQEFKSQYPDGKVLSRDTGYTRPYGSNPYTGYDNINNSPFLYRGPETPGRLPPMARVITVDLNGEAVAYPYNVLEDLRVINDTVGGEDVVVLWQPGTASALDSASLADGTDIGTAVVFSRQLDDQILSFTFDGSQILDDQTGSQWNLLGQAVGGQLQGKQLDEVVSINHFWFSWAAFKPETRVYQP
jgi:hypothetical protein